MIVQLSAFTGSHDASEPRCEGIAATTLAALLQQRFDLRNKPLHLPNRFQCFFPSDLAALEILEKHTFEFATVPGSLAVDRTFHVNKSLARLSKLITGISPVLADSPEWKQLAQSVCVIVGMQTQAREDDTVAAHAALEAERQAVGWAVRHEWRSRPTVDAWCYSADKESYDE